MSGCGRAPDNHTSRNTFAMVVCILVGLLNFFVIPAHCQLLDDDLDADGQWRIQADQLSYNRQKDLYTASGDVIITRGDSQLRADTVRLDRKTMMARAYGNVHFTVGPDNLVGDRLVIDLDSGTGTLYEGMAFIEENHFFIKGDRIEKTGEATYRIADAGLTACEQRTPDWRITGKEVNVTVEGYGTIKHAAFWVKKVPIFYVPFFIFPAKTERQSGLLPPRFGYSGRNGLEYQQPYFWAISDYADATFYYHHLSERGEKPGVEFRYAISENSRGTLIAEGFDDRKVDDGTPGSNDWGYTDDNVLRPNSDRYWFRMKADQELPYDFTAKLDIDIVSDQDYLREFDDWYLGYNATEDYFESTFGRDLDDKNDPVRENRLNFNRTWLYSAFNADFVWYDDVIARRFEDENDTLQRLPMVTYNALKQPLYENRIFGSLFTEYDHFYRIDGMTGNRVDIHPRLYFPLYAGDYFTFEPSAGYRQTAWYVGDRDDEFAGDRYNHRDVFDIGADLFTDVNRIFSVSAFGIEAIKHTIIPRLEYQYIPDVDQSDLPDFDEIDRIEERNDITFSLTHFFTSKRIVQPPGNAPAENYYNMFGRLMIEQAYDFNDGEETENGLAPLYAELDFTPANLVTLHADTEWSYLQDKFISGNLSVRLTDPRGDRFRVDYRYNQDFNETIYFAAAIPVVSWLDVYGNYEKNLMDGEDIEMRIGTVFKSGCWAVDFSYAEDEENDIEYGVMVHLYGLGEIGSRPRSSPLSRNPNYGY